MVANNPLMISASKTTFSHYNIKILRPKVTKYLTNLLKKFCEFRPKNFLKRETFFLKQNKIRISDILQ